MSGRSIADSMRSCSGVLCKRVRFCSNSVWLLRWRRRAFEFRLPGQSASGEAQMPAKVQSAGNRRRMKRYLLLLASNLVLAVAYFASGRFGLSLAFANPSASPVWPPTGLALAGVALMGYRVWPGIFAGAFLVNLSTAGTVATSLGVALGNTLEAVAGGWFLKRLGGDRRALERVPSIYVLVSLVACGSTAISATLGVTSLYLGGFVQNYSATWLTWWFGDMVSDLIIAPVILIWCAKPFPYL